MAAVQIVLILIVLLFFLLLCFLFAGLETGMLSLDQIKLEQEAKKSKSKAAILQFVRQPDKFLGTTLIGNNISNVIMASLSTYLVNRFFAPFFDARYTSLVVGIIVLIFGEIAPKAIFRDNAETLVPLLFPFLQFLYYLLKPFVMVVTLLNNFLRKLLKLEEGYQYDYLTKDDLSFLLSQTANTEIEDNQMEMIEDALDFTELEAGNVMIPRTDIVAIQEKTPLSEVINIIRKEGFTRYPVYRNNIDDIIGILIIFDILKKDYTPEMTAGDIIHEPFFAPVFDARYTSLVVGIIVLIFGEIAPKAIFRDNAETLVPLLFPFLQFLYYLLKPFVMVVTLLNNFLRKLLKLEEGYQYDYLTKDDLSFLLSQAANTEIEDNQMEMIEDALDFTELEAENVMVPRTDIVAIQEKTPLAEVINIVRKEGFTRYPVYRNNIDDIIGILIIFDILKKDYTLEMAAGDIIHEPFFAPENIDLDVLLKEMQTKQRSMAIIVDSFGGTAGIVTMEDILEEIVGDIEDEYDTDEDEHSVQQVGPNTWLVAADTEIDKLADDYGIELPEGDYETIAGLILDRLEKIPHQGQVINVPPYKIQVLQATSKQIIKVKIHKTNKIEV